MRLIIINFIIVFIILLIFIYKKYNKIEVADIILSSLTGLLSIILSFILIAFMCSYANTEEYVSDTQSITCIMDNSNTQGSKYIFSGYINEKQVYKTFVLNKDGSKNYKEVSAYTSKIYEDGKNKIITYNLRFTNSIFEWLIKGVNMLDTQTRYEIHTPKDSITTEFNIDLNN